MGDSRSFLRECRLSDEGDEGENEGKALHEDLLNRAGAVDEIVGGIMPDPPSWGKTAGSDLPTRRTSVRGYLMNMSIRTQRTLAYTSAWFRAPEDVVEDEVTLDRDGTPVPATLVRPRDRSRDLPAWVVMHGVTRPGRAHGQLVRFTRALAHAGIATIVPEVPEWRDLELAPGLSAPSIAAAIRWLRDSGVVRDAPVGVVGFSFGAPHAIGSWADPRLRDEIGAACGFGGYCSIRHTFHFLMTGRHEVRGKTEHLRPDPYGRWIVAANYLPSVPGLEDATDVAEALRALAQHAGDVGAVAWDPRYDPAIDDLRRAVAEERRSVFDLFAPKSGAAVPESEAAAMGEMLEEAARRTEPAIDPTSVLAEVRGTVHLLHGRNDRLIPCSESDRLAEALTQADPRLTITRLFGHSAQDPFPLFSSVVEVPRFASALGAVLAAL